MISSLYICLKLKVRIEIQSHSKKWSGHKKEAVKMMIEHFEGLSKETSSHSRTFFLSNGNKNVMPTFWKKINNNFSPLCLAMQSSLLFSLKTTFNIWLIYPIFGMMYDNLSVLGGPSSIKLSQYKYRVVWVVA